VPECLIPTLDSCTFPELIEFSNRQLKITRVYAPHLWRSVLIGSLLFTTVFFGGFIVVISRAAQALSFALPLLLLLIVYALGAVKAYVRLRAVSGPLEAYHKHLFTSLPAHVLLWPLASALFLLNAIAALFSRRIEWREITYELKSATEAVIIRK